MRIRHQLPAYSPVSVRGLTAAARPLVSAGSDLRPQLRRVLSHTYDAKAVVLCASGTQALQLALEHARSQVEGNRRIALPAFTCFDVATAAVGAGSLVNLYDVDPRTLAPDPDSLERVLRDGVRVVVVGPLYGVPVEWEKLQALADRHHAVLVEDAAQGHGATWRGRPLGSLGQTSMLSFGRGKGWTGGSGGAVLFRGVDAAAGSGLEPHGGEAGFGDFIGLLAQWAFGRPAVYGIPRSIPLGLGETIYREPLHAAPMTRAAAAALLESAGAAVSEAAHRRSAASRILRDLETIDGAQAVDVPVDGVAGYLRFPLRLSRGMQSFDDTPEALAAGISPGYPRLLSDLPPIARTIEGVEKRWPGAAALVRELVTLPVHSRVSEEDTIRCSQRVRSSSTPSRPVDGTL